MALDGDCSCCCWQKAHSGCGAVRGDSSELYRGVLVVAKCTLRFCSLSKLDGGIIDELICSFSRTLELRKTFTAVKLCYSGAQITRTKPLQKSVSQSESIFLFGYVNQSPSSSCYYYSSKLKVTPIIYIYICMCVTTERNSCTVRVQCVTVGQDSCNRTTQRCSSPPRAKWRSNQSWSDHQATLSFR